MAGTVDFHRSTYDETGGMGIGGHIAVDVEQVLAVPLEFVRRDVNRTELVGVLDQRQRLEYNQRERVAEAAYNVFENQAIERSPPPSPEPSNNGWRQ